MIPQSYMIMDMQFGSTGKGLLAGYLAKKLKPDTVVTAWSPNAGHTFIDNERKYVHTMLANGIVSPRIRAVLIGAGSVINLDSLHSEIMSCLDHLKDRVTIVIHPNAAIVNEGHRKLENKNIVIGSTMKGSAEAAIQKMRRNPENMNIAKYAIPKDWLRDIASKGIKISVSSIAYHNEISRSNLIQIEGAQGFSLSIQDRFYPYCTSRDVSPNQVLADCSMPYGIRPIVYGTLRTYPIRVSNRKDENGNIVGYSGDVYSDQFEIDWEDIGIEKPELTTVTKLPRRVFTFSHEQLLEAVIKFNPSKVFLNFVNYLDNDQDVKKFVEEVNKTCSKCNDCKVGWLGYGDSEKNITEIY